MAIKPKPVDSRPLGDERSWARTHGTREALMARLSYDPVTGVFTWRCLLGDAPRIRGWNTRYGGKVAGAVNANGYVQINIAGRLVYAHRIAWLFEYGEWPVHEIDHENLNTADNRIANLRPATRLQNLGNRKRLSTNTTGHKGVSFHKRSGKFLATIVVAGKQRYLGRFSTAEEAASAYRIAAVKHFGEFARVA